MKKRDTIILATASLIFFAVFNYSIAQRENLRRNGAVVLLELAPVDPRSLMQGDYMSLRYRMADEVQNAESENDLPQSGALVIRVDARDVASFVRVHKGERLADDEKLLRYRTGEDEIRLASDAYFFQEGDAEIYNAARFGELRVASDGTSLLTNLRDENLNRLEASTR